MASAKRERKGSNVVLTNVRTSLVPQTLLLSVVCYNAYFPYSVRETNVLTFIESSAEGDWPSGGPPAATPATTAAAIQAVTHQFPNGEGFYPMYYPPHGPGPYLPPPPPPHDGQPGPDGSPPHPNGAPPTVPYFIHGGYPPFGHYPPFMHGAPPLPHAPLPPAQPQPPQTVDPAATSASKVTETTNGNHAAPSVENGTGKKRTRASKGGGEPKMKKVKHSAKASKEDEGVVEDGGAEGD